MRWHHLRPARGEGAVLTSNRLSFREAKEKRNMESDEAEPLNFQRWYGERLRITDAVKARR